MNDLKPETRALLAAARGAESLSRQDRNRIKGRVLVQVAALGASATVGGGAAAMSLATKLTLVVSSVAVLGGGAVSVWVWQRPSPVPVEATRRPTPAVRSAKVETATAQPATEAPPAPPATPAPARHEGARYGARRLDPAAEIAAQAPVVDTVAPLDPELRVLREAQDDLRVGLPAQALRRLMDFERRFGAGSLGQERQAVAAIAFCQAQPGAAAQARAQAFLRGAPESPLAARVRSACAPAPTGDKRSNENERSREP